MEIGIFILLESTEIERSKYIRSFGGLFYLIMRS